MALVIDLLCIIRVFLQIIILQKLYLKGKAMDKNKEGKRTARPKREDTNDYPIRVDPVFPIVNDPPVPNRAHTEMRVDYPPEFPET